MGALVSAAVDLEEALEFIGRYCGWMHPPDSEWAAAQRLVADGITSADLARLDQPGAASMQDRIDALIYGGSG